MGPAAPDPLRSFEIDYSSGMPVWIQVKNRLAYLIGAGEYEPGAKLPTVRSLAVDLDISYNTVNRAYMDLEREGLINTRKGRGTFVAERGPAAASSLESAVDLVVDDMIRICGEAGLSDENIIGLVYSRLEQRRRR